MVAVAANGAATSLEHVVNEAHQASKTPAAPAPSTAAETAPVSSPAPDSLQQLFRSQQR